MRKMLTLVLAFVLAFSISGCGEEKLGGTQIDTEQTDPAQTQDRETEPTQTRDQETEPAQEIPEKESRTTVIGGAGETTVVDNEECTIQITGVADDVWGYTVKAYLENKSADKTYMFSVTGASINGVQTDPFFASEVAPGKKANVEILFSDIKEELPDLDAYTDIMLMFRVYDSNDWSAEPVAEPSVRLYPLGQENAVKYAREPQDTDRVLCDTDAIKVTVIGVDPDNTWGYALKLCVENKTEDKTIMVSADQVSVNGFMLDPFFATEVLPGCCKFDTMSWSSDSFAENGITEVTDVEMELCCYDSNNWDGNDLVNEVVRFQP